MTAQWIVAAWVLWMVGAAALLLAARLALAATSSIAERARVVQFALVAALALPAWMLLTPVPSWRWPLLAASGDAESIAAGAVDDARSPVNRRPVHNVAATDGALSIAAGEASQDKASRRAAEDVSTQAEPRDATGDSGTLLGLTARLASRTFTALSDPWTLAATLLGGLQLGAALFFTIEWLIGRRRLRRLIAESAPAVGTLAVLWNELAERHARTARVVTSTAVGSPLVCGGAHRVIVLPQTLATGDPAALRYCLRHELAHLEQGDLWWARVLWWARFCLWPQPLFWRLQRELKLCQELAADAYAAEAGDEVEYAALLLSLAQMQTAPAGAGALAFVDRSSQLTRRVTMLLNSSSAARRRCSTVFSLSVAGAALAAIALLGGRIDVIQAQAPADQAAAPANVAVALKYTGRVVDEQSGEPLAGATVTVRRSILTNRVNKLLLATRHTTDAKGQYSFEISPEHAAERSLYIELDAEARGFASRMGFGYALGMILRNEKFGGRPFFEEVKLSRGRAVTGKVLDSQGRPRAGVFVQGFSMRNRDLSNASFCTARTDAAGAFRLEFFVGAEGCLWVIPEDEAIVGRFVAADAPGDLGEIRTTPGVRVSGRLLDDDGKPIAGRPVEIRLSASDPVAGSLPVSSSNLRGVLTDREGRFELAPLGPGEYRLSPSDTLADPLSEDETRYELPGVYAPIKIELKTDVPPAAVELRPAPHTTLRMQGFNGEGKKAGTHEFWVSGEWNGEYWSVTGRPDAEGAAVVKLPLELKEARVALITNEHSVSKARLGADKPWVKDAHFLTIESVGPDLPTLEVVRYRSPVVAVNVVDEQKQPIKDAKVVAHYVKNNDPKPEIALMGSDVQFEEQANGWRRSTSMLPNEDVFLIVGAEGYETKRDVVNLPEGENRELTITLVKQPGNTK